jgi:hypothetical protein
VVGLKSLIKLATRSICRMSAALSPSAASALLSALSCVCCATLPVAVEVEVVEGEEVDLVASCEPEALSAFALDAFAPELPVPAACVEVLEGRATVAEPFVGGCTREAPLDGSAEVLGALKIPAACAVVSADSMDDDGVN